MNNQTIARQLRSNMFAERATIDEAMNYAYELIHTLRPQDRIAAITALHVLTNTIANTYSIHRAKSYSNH